ncbi:PP2C family protein-serine/threonine phosphatase [Streptomyces wuyuanensis]|uniref:Serine phosphatase RsbU, regulator of sigma subunit n=1 Tax=Streptomyces wuyuanensis TaxID=1196353 RepID=A0A1G9PTM9_9ACTN|nr:SpoIIE family protein phosphatase [Streptomyces wuyuanensis]SDM02152.1 Serine phosphatase RsbU, regulator of sigma subunit [Streptomyces wuyuanensis]
MPSHLFADRPAPQPPRRGSVDELISQTRRLRGDVDAVRRDAVVDEDDPQGRWQRALCDLAVHQLDDLGAHLGQLKEGLPVLPEPEEFLDPQDAPHDDLPPRQGSLLSRVGSAEWNLLTDEVSWSEELHQIFGRPAGSDPMTLDELPSMVFAEDQGLLTEMVTDCLVDGKPIDGEFRIVRTDGRVRTLHMMGEPVLDADGCTASMWAVLRDVSELRRSQRAVRESQGSLARRQHVDRTERRVAADMHEAVLPPWRGALSLPASGPTTLELAGHQLPSAQGTFHGGQWFDAQELPGGRALLSVGDLTGQGIAATSTMAMLLGALRALALAGIRPGPLMGHLNGLLDASAQPALGSAVCCHYDPETRLLSWAQGGHPAPLLFRGGTGRALPQPDGVLLGATPGGAYEQAEVGLLPGDVLVLHTDGLTRGTGTAHDSSGRDRLLALAPEIAVARSVQECARLIVEEFGESERQDDACVMVVRVGR